MLTSPSPGAPAEERRGPVAVHRAVDDWSARTGLRRANDVLRAEAADLVHVFFPDSVLGERYRIPAALGARHVPLVTTFWNVGLGRRSPVATKLEALALLARSRAVTSHDPFYLRFLRRSVGRFRPVSWLPVGNNLRPDGPAARAPELQPPAPYVAYFGQVDPTRGLEDLFEALASLRRDRDVRLVMIGSAGREERYAADDSAYRYFRRIRALPAELGVDEAVVWTPYLPDADVVELLRGADLCVLPYRRSSVGRSALAVALDVGAPVVLAGRDVTPLRAGEQVALVAPGAPSQLAATIAGLLDDPDERARLVAGARRAAELFSWPRIAAAAQAVYRRVCA